MLEDRQTDGQTNVLIAVLCYRYRGRSKNQAMRLLCQEE